MSVDSTYIWRQLNEFVATALSCGSCGATWRRQVWRCGSTAAEAEGSVALPEIYNTGCSAQAFRPEYRGWICALLKVDAPIRPWCPEKQMCLCKGRMSRQLCVSCQATTALSGCERVADQGPPSCQRRFSASSCRSAPRRAAGMTLAFMSAPQPLG